MKTMKMILAGVLPDVAFALPGTEEPIQQVWRYERRVVRLHIQGNDRNESQLVY